MGDIQRPGHSVGFLLSQLGYATSRNFRQTLAPLGLEPRQFAMLRFIGTDEGRRLTLNDARRFGSLGIILLATSDRWTLSLALVSTS